MITITKYSIEKTQAGTICSLAEAKKQVQVETSDTDDDTMLSALIQVATENVEDDLNAAIFETTNVLTYTIGDENNESINTKYKIELAPLISVSLIEKYESGSWVSINSSAYKVITSFSFFVVEFLENITGDKLRFTFKTGYADADRPKTLKQAVLLRVADLYTNERQGYNLNSVVETRAYSRLVAAHRRVYW